MKTINNCGYNKMHYKEFVKAKVSEAYRINDIPCTPTVLAILSEIFGIEINKQTIDASYCLSGGIGGYRAQCGLVNGAVMFIGIIGTNNGYDTDMTWKLCHDYAFEFEKRFGSLICRELRPEGFKEDNPPYLCENITIDSIVFSIQYIARMCKADPIEI